MPASILKLPKNSKITITVTEGTSKLQLETIVLEVNEKGLFLKPIQYDGKTLSFNSNSLHVKACSTAINEKPIEWSNCKIALVSYKGIKYHFLQTGSLGLEINRREAFRLPLSLKGKAQLKLHSKSIDVLVHDVSTTGFSIITEGNADTEIGETCTLQFSDTTTYNDFSLTGKIVRMQLLHNNRMLYGCQLLRKNAPGISEYIARKQLECKREHR